MLASWPLNTPGILPLAKELHLEKYGSYILSFNGAKIIDCRSKELLYNRTDSGRSYPTDL